MQPNSKNCDWFLLKFDRLKGVPSSAPVLLSTVTAVLLDNCSIAVGTVLSAPLGSPILAVAAAIGICKIWLLE